MKRLDVVLAFLSAAVATGTVAFWWGTRHALGDPRQTSDAPRCLR